MPFTDNFNSGVTGNTLPTYSANWVTPTGGSSNVIETGTAACASPSGAFFVNYWNATFAAAHYAAVLLHTNYQEYGGPAIRVQTGANSCFYAIMRNDGVVFAGELIAGSGTDWGSVAGFVLGDEIRLEADSTTSTTIYLKKNGTIVQTFTGKNALSGGKAGLATVNASAVQQIDSWEGADVGGAPGNASGAGVTDTAAAPAGSAGSPNTATGAGVTDTASAPTGAAGVAVTASGAGVTDAASAPAAGAGPITVTITGFRLIGKSFAAQANLTGITALIYKQIPSSLVAPDKIVTNASTNGSGILSDIIISDLQSTAARVWLVLLKGGPPYLGTAISVIPVVT